MKSFKINFYKSENGSLTKVKELFRLADAVQELISNPPEEFFEMLVDHFPLHGWVEMEEEKANVFVIFVPRGSALHDFEREQFRKWLENASPADFSENHPD
ncbi:MAG TPA: hypothetical protein PLQ76_02765 [bacterium]|nr:hypothetical protein [bacterium]